LDVDNGITVVDGELFVSFDYVIDLGIVPEVDGASNILFQPVLRMSTSQIFHLRY
jgi:hypothetical protein